MPNLMDMMPEAERQKAIERGKRRLSRSEGKNFDVSPELYITAEFGYYFGWPAVLAIKRGYINVDKGGKTVKEPFTLEEAMALLEAAKKVWYSKLIEQAHASLVAQNASQSKAPGQTFNNQMKPFTDRAEVKE